MPHSPLFRSLLLAVAAVSISGSLLLTGCSGRTQGDTNPAPGTPEFAAQVQKVQSNPNLSPRLKATIIAAMQNGQHAKRQK